MSYIFSFNTSHIGKVIFMNRTQLQRYLLEFQKGKHRLEEVVHSLELLPYESLGFATIDHHRALRQGFPEVIFCEGKTAHQVAHIGRRLSANHQPLLATRASREQFRAIKRVVRDAKYYPSCRVITAHAPKISKSSSASGHYIMVITAGTSDIPVAEEAVLTATMFGHHVKTLFDVGVAGIHRVLSHQSLIKKANVIIVVAGMEGALASVIGGLCDVPVIAVPTSVGYGASFKGVSALLGMLNSCAAGVTVVNIDNGFGAGFAASLINKVRR
jgi:pyridinium-3,5-biscarboxylic acid mononucleotide synthase